MFELFQSAYSGAPERTEDSNLKEFTIYEITSSGKRLPVYVQKKKKEQNVKTQLDAMVQYMASFCQKNQLKKLPEICLPSLEECIEFPIQKALSDKSSHIVAEIGIYDDPDNQLQDVYSVDLTNQNMMIIGSAQSGKTNLLQTLIRSVTTKYTPQDVNIYIIDFASMYLKNFETLNHVGGVVTASEDEKLKNLFKLLYKEIAFRKEKILSLGVSSFSAYKEAGFNDLPQIIVMVDNLTTLKELYFQDNDELLNICRDGLAVGVSVVIANAQMSGIGYRYLSNFACRVALFNNDSSEYSSLFDYCHERINDIHGRCLVEVDKVHLECQTFLSFTGEKEYERVSQMKEYIEAVNQLANGKRAKAIPVIPNVLTMQQVSADYANEMRNYDVVAGLDFASVMPFNLELNGIGAIALSGRKGMGIHNFMRYLVRILEQRYSDKTEVYIIDGFTRKLADVEKCKNVKEYEVLPAKSVDILCGIEKILQERYEKIAIGESNLLDEAKMIMVIINNAAALEEITNNLEAQTAYNNIVGKYKNMNACIVVGDYPNENISYSAPDIIKKIRDARNFIFFDDLTNMKIIDLPLAAMREHKKPIEAGEAFYIHENEVRKLKTVKC